MVEQILFEGNVPGKLECDDTDNEVDLEFEEHTLRANK